MKQAKNEVIVEGYLLSCELEERTDKEDRDFISGEIVIEVSHTINGREELCEVPLKVFQYKLTKEGKNNRAYESIKDIYDSGISLASVNNDHDKADKLSCTRCSFAENQFPSNGNKICYSFIRGGFFNKVRNTFNQKASFETEIMIKSISEEEKDEVPTGRLKLTGIIVQYNDNCDIVDFIAETPESVQFISSAYQEGDTVKVSGRIRCTVEEKEEVSNEEVGFGEPEMKTVVKKIKEFVITSASKEPYPEETAYNTEDIVKALTAKKEAYDKKHSNAQDNTSGDLRGF